MNNNKWHASTDSRQYGLVTFAILCIAGAASITIGWQHSNDVKGWWPFLLVAQLIYAAVYALAFRLIVARLGWVNLWWVTRYNACLGFAMVVHALLYYGVVRVRELDPVVRSDLSFWLIGLFFLLAPVGLNTLRSSVGVLNRNDE